MAKEKSRSQLKGAVRRFQKHIYLFSFFEGLIFWYAIEKLFMQSIGLSIATIVTIGLIAQAGKMVFEIPSSVLADRWNRRNTLILGTLIMVIASALLPLAKTGLEYTLFVLLWTAYYAFKSGTDTAFIFDSLRMYRAERQFQHILARYHSWEYIGLIVSGLVTGFIVTATNVQIPFWLTVVPLLCGAFVLWRLPEPRLENHDEQSKWWSHAVYAAREIKQRSIVWVVALYAMLFALLFIWYEYYQVYGLAVHTPDLWFGSLLAVMCLGLIAGAEITRRITITKKVIVLFWLVLAATHLSGFLVTSFVSCMLIIFVTMAAIQVLYLSFVNTINQNIGSARRATVISLAGSASQVMFLPLALLFRAATDAWSVQAAFTVASLPLLILGLVDVARRIPWLKVSSKSFEEPLAEIDGAGELR
jgi:MFS family permease